MAHALAPQADVQLEMFQVEVADYGVPMLFADSTLDTLVGNVIFFYTVMQQSQLQNSIHMVAIIGLMFAMYALITHLSNSLNEAIASGNQRRVWILKISARLLYFALVFISGLFVRIFSDRVVNGPHVGGFGLARLVWPFAALVLMVCFFSHTKLATQQNQLVVTAVRAEHNDFVSEYSKL